VRDKWGRYVEKEVIGSSEKVESRPSRLDLDVHDVVLHSHTLSKRPRDNKLSTTATVSNCKSFYKSTLLLDHRFPHS
jgi:hypothetical protein